jgi:small conductance mechanosensitive channel
MDGLQRIWTAVWHDLLNAGAGEDRPLIVKAATACVLLIATYFFAKFISRSVSGSVCKRVDETVGKFLGRLSFYAVIVGGGVAILGQAGLDVTGLVGVLTAAGFAIGLAFQGTLSNFASGILLLVFRPFKVGDLVVVAGLTGRINEIDLFMTTIDTTDNRRLVIPNSSITGGTIENVTYHPHRRVEVIVGVAYKCNLDATRATLAKAAEMLQEWMIPGEGRGYQILLTSLSSSSVEWTVRFWTARENFFKSRELLAQEIKRQLDAAGLEIPFPQMQLHYTPTLPKKPVAEANTDSASHPVKPRLRGTLDGAPSLTDALAGGMNLGNFGPLSEHGPR